MFVEAVIIGLLIGLLRGGRMANLAKVHLKGGVILFALLILQLSMVFWGRFEWIIPYRTHIAFGLSLLIFLVASISLSKSTAYLLPLGALLNLLAMSFNAFKMPVLLPSSGSPYYQTLKSAITSGEIFNYMLFQDAHPWLRFLGKVIPLPEWYYGLGVLSIGDVLIAIGLILFIQFEMNNTMYFRRSTFQKFPGYKKNYKRI